MRDSFFEIISQQDLDAYVRELEIPEFVYPSLFPLKFTPTLTWSSLSGETGVPVAADVISYNASAPQKTRPTVKSATGDIPKISVKRPLGESKINEYRTLLNYASSSSGLKSVLELIYNDVEFVYKAVNARLEWLALSGLSTGRNKLTQANNNNTLVTETNIDFHIPDENRIIPSGLTVAKQWTVANAASSDPIGNIREIVRAARGKGYRIKYILMDEETFVNMAASASVVKFAASWLANAGNFALTPQLSGVNTALSLNGLPEIRFIDSQVTLEAIDGTHTVVSPWADGIVAFITDAVVGKTFHAPVAAETINVDYGLKTKREHVFIHKWAEIDPTVEWTLGAANAFPVLNDPASIWLFDSKGSESK